MADLSDVRGRIIRLTDERRDHLESDHPEMVGQVERVGEVLLAPQRIVRSRTDSSVDLYYRLYEETPVTTKYLCVVVKNPDANGFVITSYFTDTIKKGELRWPTT